MIRLVLRLLPCLAILLTAGCSTYDKRFTSASRSDVKHRPHEGAYSGKWTSASHPGGGGNLRCILTQVNGTDFLADFHATWHAFSSEHKVVLHTKPATRRKAGRQLCDDGESFSGKGARDFEGTSELRTIIGAGTYSCKGTMDNRTLRACYDATYDKGAFQLTRIVSPETHR